MTKSKDGVGCVTDARMGPPDALDCWSKEGEGKSAP